MSLGLLNSSIALQLLVRLPSKEFFAAMYVASDAMANEERKSFLRSNIENDFTILI